MAELHPRNHELRLSKQSRRHSRSPHPYRFHGSDVLQSNESVRASNAGQLTQQAVSDENLKQTSAGYFDGSRRKRRHLDDSSESATDADDEKESLLLSLPAPALRPRKGFKGQGGSLSPLLTPTYIDEAERTASLDFNACRETSQEIKRTDEDTTKLREKFRKKRRAEIIRRATETSLFLAIFCIGIYSFVSNALDRSPESLAPLWIFSLTVITLYLLYPLRIILHNHKLSVSRHKPWYYIHLPAAFDPAPLLYPVLLPASVACLVGRSSNSLLLPNLILGVSSVPSKIIPFGALGWCGSSAWVLAILPLLGLHQSSDLELVEVNQVWYRETSSLLFALHQTVLPILESLTTTSLLPAELQLLSTGLINLLVLADTPQAFILKALLWMGPIGLLILCSKLLRVGVAITRIPSWRLRRPNLPPRSRFVIIQATHDLCEIFGLGKRSRDESSDDDNNYRPARISRAKPSVPNMKPLSLEFDPMLPILQKTPTVHTAVIDDFNIDADHLVNGHAEISAISRRRRRNTLPSDATSTEYAMSFSNPGMTVRTASRLFQKASLRKLTAPQATLLRWIMAFYFYITVILLILLPMKVYVQRKALHDKEPIAWALDYLFGDLSSFHGLVDQWAMRQWIPYEDHGKIICELKTGGRAAKLRSQLGLANTRLVICAFAMAVIACGLIVVFRLSPVADVDTRRKVFHGMMVVMFLPTTFVDPTFIGLALALVLAIFLLLDLIRASQLPPLAMPITHFLAPYVDGRDHRGPVIVSHIFLLIGCAIPLWLSLASAGRTSTSLWDGWEIPTRDLSMVSGIICVGMGDAAASLFGRRYGRRRWCWSGGKSLEGSLAFAIAVVVGLTLSRAWHLLGQWAGDSGDSLSVFWLKSLLAGCGASLTEAVLTGGNDNVIVPVILWLLVKGLAI